MSNLIEIQKAADKLSAEERAGLATHLLASLPGGPVGADDEEADRRDEEMDSGAVKPISHSQFVLRSWSRVREVFNNRHGWICEFSARNILEIETCSRPAF